MPPDHPCPLLPMHLRRGRQGHPHQYPHYVLRLLCLWEVGHSWRSAELLKMPRKLRPWPGNLMAETGVGVSWAVHSLEAPCPIYAARSPGIPALPTLAPAWEEDTQISPRRVR